MSRVMAFVGVVASAHACADLYEQCGGTWWSGTTCCAEGECVCRGASYCQCAPSPTARPTARPTPNASSRVGDDDAAANYSSPCLGALRVSGASNAVVTLAGYDQSADPPSVTSAETALALGRNTRVFVADACVAGGYAPSRYAAWSLLGKSLSFDVDMSAGAGCGCNVAVYLTAMARNADAGDCGGDYYCDAAYVCSSTACTEIDLIEANQYAFRATLHLVTSDAVDSAGVPKGLGGGHADFSSAEYGVGGSHFDTSKPFTVTAAFPADAATGALASVNVTLSQAGGAGALALGWGAYSYYDTSGQLRSDGLARLGDELDAGLTPVVSYWDYSGGGGSMQWLDGGSGGPCATDDAASCASDGGNVSSFAIASL